MDDFAQTGRRMKRRNIALAVCIVIALAYLTGFGRDLYDAGRGFHDGFVQGAG